MIITIEDAPAVKHITIDIDFDETGEACTTVVKEEKLSPNPQRDTALNLTEEFERSKEEVVQKPEIVTPERATKVVEEMQNLEI